MSQFHPQVSGEMLPNFWTFTCNSAQRKGEGLLSQGYPEIRTTWLEAPMFCAGLNLPITNIVTGPALRVPL